MAVAPEPRGLVRQGSAHCHPRGRMARSGVRARDGGLSARRVCIVISVGGQRGWGSGTGGVSARRAYIVSPVGGQRGWDHFPTRGFVSARRAYIVSVWADSAVWS
jgi:hypothetical protein